ncbi:hypothetical protein NDU88_000159 [Pleurodeles waltl]|uniref:Uncharacterized protein n=1 Tax=Pleurodeles waltl TaxID=8319 RepID=A0AAV7TEM8_PLEWA|nr:hypothetical protein NDU88_000159 [Pleurodeles waltl]
MVTECAGVQLTPKSVKSKERRAAAMPRVLVSEPGTRVAEKRSVLQAAAGRCCVGRQRAAASGPHEKKRPHRALKYGTGPVGSTERLGRAHGVEPPSEDYRAPGGALQSQSRTGGNGGEGGSD